VCHQLNISSLLAVVGVGVQVKMILVPVVVALEGSERELHFQLLREQGIQ
jgi:hypothetical protein